MRSKGTYLYNKDMVSRINKHFGHMELKHINKHTMLDVIHKLRQTGISNVTVNKTVATINRILEYHDYNAVTNMKMNERVPSIEIVSDTNINKVLTHFKVNSDVPTSHRNYIFFKLLLDTGLRLNEILNVRVKNIDYKLNSILVEVTKTNVDRNVFFTSETATELKSFIEKYNIVDYLFINFDTGKRLQKDAVQCFIARAKKRLSIRQGITPHKWRHTFATKFLVSGGDLETLRLIMGHTTLLTTQRYLHFNNKELLSNNYKNVIK